MPPETPQPQPARAGNTSWVFFVVVGFLLGNGTGYLAGVIVGSKPHASDEPSTETPADLTHPRFLEGHGWSVSYPANWTLAATSPGADPDREFLLESPGRSAVQVWVRDEPSDLNEELAQQIVSYARPLIEEPTVTALTSWGRYPGRGQELRGRLAGDVPGGVRIFAANVAHRSFTAIERSIDEDHKSLEPGFRLVQDSFMLK